MIFCAEYWHQIFRHVSLYLTSLVPIKLESKKGRFDSMSEPDIPGVDPDEDYGLAVARPELKKPSMYKVIMLNDDYTPMEFVIHVLELFFNLDQEKATQIMLTVHTKGAAVCGVYPKDIAETKAEHVVEYAKENQHPLMCQIDAAED